VLCFHCDATFDRKLLKTSLFRAKWRGSWPRGGEVVPFRLGGGERCRVCGGPAGGEDFLEAGDGRDLQAAWRGLYYGRCAKLFSLRGELQGVEQAPSELAVDFFRSERAGHVGDGRLDGSAMFQERDLDKVPDSGGPGGEQTPGIVEVAVGFAFEGGRTTRAAIGFCLATVPVHGLPPFFGHGKRRLSPPFVSFLISISSLSG